MGKRPPNMRALGVTLTLVLMAWAPALRAQSRSQRVTAVTSLDENRLQGTWYEVASYPFKPERRCVSNSIELIAPGEKHNQLQLVDACTTKRGYTDARNETANAEEKNGGGEFKVRTIWPFSRKYWILALGQNYEWALIGSPNHRTLWVFSKTPTLSPQVLAEIEAKGASEGFPSARLVQARQTPQ